jgi:hypothetical protein
MNTRRLIISFAVIAVLLTLSIPTTVRADNNRIYFTGIETGCEDWVVEREWMAGPTYHLRIDTQTCYEEANIPQFTGTLYPHDGVINFGGMFGTINGKFRMETEEGGVWVGNFELSANSNTISGVGHGEGIYAGQQMRVFTNAETGEFWGYIINGG